MLGHSLARTLAQNVTKSTATIIGQNCLPGKVSSCVNEPSAMLEARLEVEIVEAVKGMTLLPIQIARFFGACA